MFNLFTTGRNYVALRRRFENITLLTCGPVSHDAYHCKFCAALYAARNL